MHDYLLRRAVVFDDLRLLYVPVPKAGSTTILRALAELAGLTPEDFARSRKLEVTRALTVHDETIWGSSYQLEGRSSEEVEWIVGSDEWFRVSVVREPARRLWSGWVSKVLFRDPRFVVVFGEDSFPAAPATAMDVLESFRRFVCALPQRAAWHDPHWLPQSDLIGAGDVVYAHVGRVEQLEHTADVVGEYLERMGARLPAVGRENPSILPFTPGVFDRPAREACNLWTARDLDTFGYEPLPTGIDAPTEEWHARVEAVIPAIGAVIERNERIGDLKRVLEDADPQEHSARLALRNGIRSAWRGSG